MKTGSLINELMDGTVPVKPKVGMGATELHWTDRTAYTITDVRKDGKAFLMQEDEAIPLHTGMTDSQRYEYKPNPRGVVKEVTLRKDGKWRIKKSGKSMSVLIGARQKYHDFSF